MFNGTLIEVMWAKPVKDKSKESKRKSSLPETSNRKIKPKNPKSTTCDNPQRSVSCSPTMPTTTSCIPLYQPQQVDR